LNSGGEIIFYHSSEILSICSYAPQIGPESKNSDRPGKTQRIHTNHAESKISKPWSIRIGTFEVGLHTPRFTPIRLAPKNFLSLNPLNRRKDYPNYRVKGGRAVFFIFFFLQIDREKKIKKIHDP